MNKTFIIQKLDLEQIQERIGQPIWIHKHGSMESDLCGIVYHVEDQYTVHFCYGREWLDDVWEKHGESGIYGTVPEQDEKDTWTMKPFSFGALSGFSIKKVLARMAAAMSDPHVVYIAGKITGDANYREKFAQAQEALEKEGYIVANPALLPGGLPYECYYPMNCAMIDQCDSVYFLRDWNESRGARAEMKYALENGKGILTE